jgi:hypothetical protein
MKNRSYLKKCKHLEPTKKMMLNVSKLYNFME